MVYGKYCISSYSKIIFSLYELLKIIVLEKMSTSEKACVATLV